MNKNKPRKNKGGRPNKYFTNVEPRLEAIKMWRRDGQTEENIAKLLDVGYSTFMFYKTKYPELVEALKVSSEDLIATLERTLFQVALGNITTTDTKVIKDIANDGTVKIREETFTKQIPPSTTALIFSLKNLASRKWSDGQYNQEDNNKDKEIIESIGILVDDIKNRKTPDSSEEKKGADNK